MLRRCEVRMRFGTGLLLLATVAASQLNDKTVRGDDDQTRPSAPARLKFLQKALQDMKVESTEAGDQRDLKFLLTPLLRYNGTATHGIADSMIFRLGGKGRPIALVTAELYGGNGRQFLLNHEFLAIDDSKIQLKRDKFLWMPPRKPR